jgi:hypothetical protein
MIHDEEAPEGEVAIKGGGFSGPLTEYLRAQYIKETGITEEEYLRRWAAANHVHLVDPAHTWSDANRSIPRTGLSGALDEHAPAEGPEHASNH